MIRRTEQIVRQWVAVHGEARVVCVNIDLQDVPGVRIVRGGDVDIYAVLDGEVDMGQAQRAKVVIFETDGAAISMKPSHHPYAGIPKSGYQETRLTEQIIAFVQTGVNFYEITNEEINIDIDDIKLAPSEIPPPMPEFDFDKPEEPAFNFSIEGADPPEDDEDDEDENLDEQDEDDDNLSEPPSARVW